MASPTSPSPGPGGFIPPTLPSPAPTTTSTTSTARSISNSSSLPHPRSQALRAGSTKEEAVRGYVESRLLHISRRYTKKFQGPEDRDEDGGVGAKGYESMREVCRDINEVLDVLWLSGTRMVFFFYISESPFPSP